MGIGSQFLQRVSTPARIAPLDSGLDSQFVCHRYEQQSPFKRCAPRQTALASKNPVADRQENSLLPVTRWYHD